MEEVRNCVVCGYPYMARKVNAMFCSDKCANTYRLERAKRKRRESAELKREEIEKREKSQNEIDEYAVAAKKVGMSYGLYVAMEKMKNDKRRNKKDNSHNG